MKRKFLHFFALCVIAVSFSGCVYATNGYASVGGEISTGYPSDGYYERPHRCVGCIRPVVVAPVRTVIVKERAPKYHHYYSKPHKFHKPQYAYKRYKPQYAYKHHKGHDRYHYPKYR